MENKKDVKPMSIVWAMDPYELDLRPSTAVLDQLRTLANGSLAAVTPIFVHGLDVGNATTETKTLQDYARSFISEPLGTPEVLYAGSSSKNDWIETLLSFAETKNAEMIVLTSHGRSGLSRLVLGSFAESLLEHSKLPILFLQKAVVPGHQLQKALFTTDFSAESKAALERFLQLFGNHLSEITLFHTVVLPEEVIGMSGAAGVPVIFPESYIEDQIQWAKKESGLWLEQARKSGVTAQLSAKIEDASVLHASASIQKFVQANQIGLVGATSHRGSVGKFIFGSVTQDLLVSGQLPVWACGPMFKK
jgi:nucleotide-binding universal stress UspA family protein